MNGRTDTESQLKLKLKNMTLLYRISVEHDEARRKWMLHIAKVRCLNIRNKIPFSFVLLNVLIIWVFQAQLEDSGPYMCQLNTDPMKSKMGILNVIIRPDITEVTGARVVAEGGNVRSENLEDSRPLLKYTVEVWFPSIFALLLESSIFLLF